ncbi:hypothetical protein VTO42DRAFT_8781 [Malbranchea cinnamomea]
MIFQGGHRTGPRPRKTLPGVTRRRLKIFLRASGRLAGKPPAHHVNHIAQSFRPPLQGHRVTTEKSPFWTPRDCYKGLARSTDCLIILFLSSSASSSFFGVKFARVDGPGGRVRCGDGPCPSNPKRAESRC